MMAEPKSQQRRQDDTNEIGVCPRNEWTRRQRNRCLSPGRMTVHGAALALLIASCGYTVVRGDAPFGAHRIAVIPFQEDEPIGLSTELSRELAVLLAADGVHVTANAESADGVLTGVVLAAASSISPVAASGRIPAYRLRVVVRARLIDGERELWTASVNANDSFLPSESPASVETQTLETEANRRRALGRLAVSIARDLHQQLVIASSVKQAGRD
jgi:outer membrane lipopolysaccharide assembly protein LptE/RlpB